jgi:hypothetical protein
MLSLFYILYTYRLQDIYKNMYFMEDLNDIQV